MQQSGKKNNNVKKKENKINNVSRGRWEDGKMRERKTLEEKKKKKKGREEKKCAWGQTCKFDKIQK